MTAKWGPQGVHTLLGQRGIHREGDGMLWGSAEASVPLKGLKGKLSPRSPQSKP